MQIDDAELAQYLMEIEQYARPSSSYKQMETGEKSPKPRKPYRRVQTTEEIKPRGSKQDYYHQRGAEVAYQPEILTSKGVQQPVTPQVYLATPSSAYRSRGTEPQDHAVKAHLREYNEAMKAHIERLTTELNNLKSLDYERSLSDLITENNKLKADLAEAQLLAKTHNKAALAAQEKLTQLEKYYSTETGNTKKERQLILALEQYRQENKKLKVQVYQGLREKEQLKMTIEELYRGARRPKTAK